MTVTIPVWTLAILAEILVITIAIILASGAMLKIVVNKTFVKWYYKTFLEVAKAVQEELEEEDDD